ncbi:hypothetical protein PCCS19_55070 [Paenibacillus sp. CCS19]|uniref:DUF2508 family protein n=1 Tax=Paenibacillus sp. CCS19 TaxID=3158387 RepID=UPI00255F84B5|nr:DUF2508 family protein [Paenibacillus cellulosilyticus]GMK42447.1 hypothetical protein PCCS19_55070 [Paenibacillus cellulosilyticus]
MRLKWWGQKNDQALDKQKRREVSQEVWDLKIDIDEARKSWLSATRFFQYAVEQDEVDYAVYYLMAAEQRYSMLVRRAKALKDVNWPAWTRSDER